MKTFNYFQLKNIRFGCGRAKRSWGYYPQFKKHCILITISVLGAIKQVVERIEKSFLDPVIGFVYFDEAISNLIIYITTMETELATSNYNNVVLEPYRGGGEA